MGVGLPFGLGAKVAKPDQQVVVLHGDGSMGLNAMELDTAVRHGIDVVTVVSNNGGWTAADRPKAGRDLGYTRFDLLAQALGCHGEHVEHPDGIRPALERAASSGRPAVVNVVTDAAARARTAAFASYST
jgi:acetolactate synthase-1/2/3 large subunit